ncbi:hypothetical protein ACUWC1_29805, partial [Klebsiella pneumoniae]
MAEKQVRRSGQAGGHPGHQRFSTPLVGIYHGYPGLDEIDAAIIKASCPLIEKRLLRIMNKCLDRGHFPSQWKIAELR